MRGEGGNPVSDKSWSSLIFSVADPNHFDADRDPDPAFHFDPDPDPTFPSDAFQFRILPLTFPQI